MAYVHGMVATPINDITGMLPENLQAENAAKMEQMSECSQYFDDSNEGYVDDDTANLTMVTTQQSASGHGKVAADRHVGLSPSILITRWLQHPVGPHVYAMLCRSWEASSSDGGTADVAVQVRLR